MGFGSFRALSFDCYGTLIDWEAGIVAELASWAADSGVIVSDEELLAAFAASESEVESDHPAAVYPEVLGMTLERVAARFGSVASRAAQETFGGSVGRWPAFPDSAAALARLKERYALIILSNVDRASFAASNEQLGVEFDVIVTAEDVGAYKPSAESFQALLAEVAALGIADGQLLHVAQSLYHDHEPAKACGLSTVWIDRRHGQRGPGATPPPRTDVQPDWTFPSLAAFAEAATESA